MPTQTSTQKTYKTQFIVFGEWPSPIYEQDRLKTRSPGIIVIIIYFIDAKSKDTIKQKQSKTRITTSTMHVRSNNKQKQNKQQTQQNKNELGKHIKQTQKHIYKTQFIDFGDGSSPIQEQDRLIKTQSPVYKIIIYCI